MPFPSPTYLEQLVGAVRDEFLSLYAQLEGWLRREHKHDGSHGDISVDSLTLADPPHTNGEHGNITGHLVPMTANTYDLGAGADGAIPQQTWRDLYLGTSFRWGVFEGGGAGEGASWVGTASVTGHVTWAAAQAEGQTWIFEDHLGNTILTIGTLVDIGGVAQPGRGTTIVALQATGASFPNGLYERNRTTKQGEWTTFTPTWTNLTVGNGTVSARYSRVGKTVHFTILLVLGSTSVVGAGVQVTVPVNYTATASAQSFAIADYLDVSASQHYPGRVTAVNSSTIALWNNASPLAAVTSTVPFTWATSDQLYISGTYEEA